jgi:glycosyltransferase involved in cell wall biosynthesis
MLMTEARTKARQRRAIVAGPAPFDSGGLGTAAAEFVEGLEAHGLEPAYVGLQNPGLPSRLAGSRPFRRAFGATTRRVIDSRAVRQAVSKNRWDLIYAMPGSLPTRRRRGIRVLHQAGRHPRVERAALRRAERETGGRGSLSWIELKRREHEIERADVIHVTSKAVYEEFIAAGVDPDRVVHAYLGVDLDRFRPRTKPETLRIAFIGVLSLGKGVDTVARLADGLAGDAVVETVGGPNCPWSRRIVEKARFTPRDSVPDLLAESHVLVLPSRSDGFGYVVLEALASGAIPIVSPEVGSSEVVRRLDERLVIPRDEFPERVPKLLPQLDLEGLARRGRALAEEFDRRKTSKAMAAAVLERADGLSCASRW